MIYFIYSQGIYPDNNFSNNLRNPGKYHLPFFSLIERQDRMKKSARRIRLRLIIEFNCSRKYTNGMKNRAILSLKRHTYNHRDTCFGTKDVSGVSNSS